jgi:carboxyl-terminal processing protease
MNKGKRFLLLGVLAFAGCQQDEPPANAAAVTSYINEVLAIMESNSINRRTIDWQALRRDVLARAANAQTIAAAEPALLLALGRLGDNHSLIQTITGRTLYNGNARCGGARTAFTPTREIGYIAVPSFSGTPSQGDAYARNMQQAIREQDNPDIKGWIVDVRGDTGGNMWPMIAGIGPLLGEGLAGHFIDISGNAVPWSYQTGSSLANTTRVVTVPSPYVLIKPNPRVAVLIDNGTASSGEATVISFIGRPNTRLFGTPSCGLSTANGTFPLSDGSTLFLTVSTMADRNKNLFGGRINPDETHAGAAAGNTAVEWILR